MRTMHLLKRVDRIESFSRSKDSYPPECICFPENARPCFHWAAEVEIAARLKCPLHGDRFRPSILIYVSRWQRRKREWFKKECLPAVTLSSDMDRHHCDPVVQVDVAQAIGRTSESHAHCVGSKANAARVESAGLLRQKSNTKGCWQLATIRLGRSRFYSCVGSFRFSFKIVCAARSGQIGLQNIVTVREH